MVVWSFVGVIRRWLDEQVERDVVELGESRRRELVRCESRDAGHCFEEAPVDDLALSVQRVAESLQDEQGEVDETHRGEGEVGHECIGVRIVVQRLCDSPVPRADRRDNTQGDLEVQPMRVDVVRFAEVVVVHLAMMGMA